MAKLFVIAGHGDGDPGACANGYSEAERVRALAARIKAFGGDSVMLGDTSKNYYKSNLISKLTIPRDYQIIELHMDSGGAAAHGGHVIVKAGLKPDAYDTALAGFIGSILPGRANLIAGRSDLANPYRAATKGYSYRLVECGFITNASDLNTFNTRMDEFANGILAAFGITSSVGGGWQQNSTGWWFKNADGNYPHDGWMAIGGAWYYFDEEGYAIHNCWKQINGHWYYFKSGCNMATGWFKVDGNWFYLNPDNTSEHPIGSMMDGWIYDGRHWYYLNPVSDGTRGAMVHGWQTINGNKYYFLSESASGNPEGSMANGWCKIDDEWYYFNTGYNCQPVGSILVNHWLTDGGKKYYLKEDGKMACEETLEIGGESFSFDKSGVLM